MSANDDSAEEFQFTVAAADQKQRLDLFLCNQPRLGLSRNQVQKLINEEHVRVNGRVAQKRQVVLSSDQIVISVPPPRISDVVPEDISIDIRFEDEYLAVVNKSAGMVVHPAAGNFSGTLVNALMHHFKNLSQRGGAERAGIVHRLDKNTSGLLLVAKTDVIHTKLQEALQKREITRQYLALVCGHLKEKEGEIQSLIGRSTKDRKKMAVTKRAGREAFTKYRLIARYRSYDLLEVELQTGRTHQIRVHFSHIGHPVFGDPEYGGRDKWHKGIFAPERTLGRTLLDVMPRQALHAKRLVFFHPIKGAKTVIESEPPEDFQKLLDKLNAEGQ